MKALSEDREKNTQAKRHRRALWVRWGLGLGLLLIGFFLWWHRGDPAQAPSAGLGVAAQPGGGEQASQFPPEQPATPALAETPAEPAAALASLALLQGHVVDESGLALVGASIELWPRSQDAAVEQAPGAAPPPAGALRATTDGAGYFALPAPGITSSRLRLSHPAEPGLELVLDLSSPAANLELCWDRPRLRRVVVQGMVQEARSNLAVDQFEICLFSATSPLAPTLLHRSNHSQAAGRFELMGLTPGSYRLRILAPGYESAETELVAPADGIYPLAFTLERLYPLHLEFQNARGEASLPECLRIEDVGGRVLWQAEAPASLAHLLQADTTLGLELPARELLLVLKHQGHELRYRLEPQASTTGVQSFLLDWDDFSSRDFVRVLVCTLPADSEICAPGWYDEINPAQAAALAEGALLAPLAQAKLELEVADRNRALLGHAQLERNDLGQWQSTFAFACEPRRLSETSDHSLLALELPRRGFRLRAWVTGCEPLVVEVEQLRPADLDSKRLLVARRLAR